MKVIFGILILTLGACSKYNIEKGKSPLSDPEYFEAGPGTVKIDSNFYADRFEVTNFNWLEYMYWTQKVYGYKSPKHLSVYPDTLFWSKYDTSLVDFEEYYLRHPSNRDYPVVGISQKQGHDYAKWRADRVFEFCLIREGVLDWNSNQTEENHFTIENYFLGKYLNQSPHPKIKYFPIFELPTSSERKAILLHSDKVNREYCTNCKNMPKFVNSFESIQRDSLGRIIQATQYVKTMCNKKIVLLSNLRGNVAEWSKEPNTTFGGGWTDSLSVIMNSDTQQQTGPSVQTGMRCVMRWVEWED